MTNKRISDQTKQIMRQQNLRNKKSLGQNFLLDDTVLDGIVEGAELDQDTFVLEIGPGIGSLTQRLAELAGKVVAVELDDSLIPVLEDHLCAYQNVKIIHNDIMKLDIKQLFTEEAVGYKTIKVVANLPYYITTPIIMRLLEEELPVTEIVIMIQREVAQRLCAQPGCKAYGAITVSVNYYCEIETLLEVPPESFLPPPKVWSSVVKLKRHLQPPVEVCDKNYFFRMIKAAFGQRRKTLVNALANFGGIVTCKEDVKKVLNKLGISENVRGETLSLRQLAQLSNELFGQICSR